jgi:hypothetical protein
MALVRMLSPSGTLLYAWRLAACLCQLLGSLFDNRPCAQVT